MVLELGQRPLVSKFVVQTVALMTSLVLGPVGSARSAAGAFLSHVLLNTFKSGIIVVKNKRRCRRACATFELRKYLRPLGNSIICDLVTSLALSVNTNHVSSFASLWDIIIFSVNYREGGSITDLLPVFGGLRPWGTFHIFENDQGWPVDFGIVQDSIEGRA